MSQSLHVHHSCGCGYTTDLKQKVITCVVHAGFDVSKQQPLSVEGFLSGLELYKVIEESRPMPSGFPLVMHPADYEDFTRDGSTDPSMINLNNKEFHD